MRADRLLTLLLLLQEHGRLSARRLAELLEVSERTIYRDIDALSLAGIPVYAESGRTGGYALLDSYRTTLTGLTEAEVRALFMISIPAPLAELGVSGELQTALRKVAAALPEEHTEARRMRQRFHLDAVAWGYGEETAPHLHTIYRAIGQDRKLRLVYHLGPLAARVEQIVDPYGLVAKAGRWYLVGAVSRQQTITLRVWRLSELAEAHPLDQVFIRLPDFDLAAFWAQWCTRQEASRTLYLVQARLSRASLPDLERLMGNRIAWQNGPDHNWVFAELRFESLEEARSRLLGFGGGVQVLAPLALRSSLIDFAQQTIAGYAEPEA